MESFWGSKKTKLETPKAGPLAWASPSISIPLVADDIDDIDEMLLNMIDEGVDDLIIDEMIPIRTLHTYWRYTDGILRFREEHWDSTWIEENSKKRLNFAAILARGVPIEILGKHENILFTSNGCIIDPDDPTICTVTYHSEGGFMISARICDISNNNSLEPTWVFYDD